MNDREKLHSLLLKARLYRLAAFVFAVMGLVVFAVLYFQNMQGNLLNALRDPYFIVVVGFPFLPAAVLSWMAVSSERKAGKLLESLKKSS